MPYAQINYGQTLGSGPNTTSIHAAGCFLTAFCNLLERFGQPIDPPTLDNYFVQHNDFIKESDGADDLLSWGSVTAYNPNVRVTASGNGKPSSNDSIVKFVYNGGTTHFCLVIDAAAGTILDSWDGKVKNWSVYGGPVSYASYTNAAPAPTTTAKPAVSPAAVQPASVVKQLVLPASISEWHVYRPGGPWTVPNAIAVLDPAKAGGLTYDILGSPATNIYLIQTEDFGEVAIYAGPDTVAQIIDKPAAPQIPTANPPAPAADPDVVNITVQAGWGITSVLAAAGYTPEEQGNEAEWDRVAALNGSATRLKLTPGEVVKVNKTALAIAAPAVPDPTPVLPTDITNITEDVTVTDTLRVRTGPSTTDSQVAIDGAPNGDLQKNDVVAITGYCHGEDVAGNDIWLRSSKGNWFWSGATNFTVGQSQALPDVTPAPAATPEVVMPPAEAVADATATTATSNTSATVTSTTSVPVTVTPAWQKTTPAPGLYRAKYNTQAIDLTGVDKPTPLEKDWIFQSAEEIVKDGLTYLRDISAKKKGVWKAVLKKDLAPTGVSLDGMKQFAKDMQAAAHDDWDDILAELSDDMGSSTISADVRTVEKDVKGIFNRKKGK